MTRTVSAIIPTLNAERTLPLLLDMLARQTHPVTEIVMIDSGSNDMTVQEARKLASVRLLKTDPAAFDHGATRDEALRTTSADFIWFLTQDAIPVNVDCLETLLKPFDDEKVAAVYARQIAPEGASRIEQLTREWNYPAHSMVHSLADLARDGVQAIRLSDCCAVYRRSAYERCGGFRPMLPANEDMLMANRFLKSGYSVFYAADAVVRHGHEYFPQEIRQRYFDIGAFFSIVRDEIHIKSLNQTGAQFVFAISKQLLREGRLISFLRFGILCLARMAGNHSGTHFQRMSRERIMRSTRNPVFWNRYLSKPQASARQGGTER